MKFMCKYCNKSYSCGKALGGHLSSHKNVMDDYYDNDNVSDAKHPIDEDEREEYEGHGCVGKKIKRSGPTLGCRHHHHVCKECGKGFQSLKALCGHMACHSEKERLPTRKYESRIGDRNQRLFVDADEFSETAVEDSGQMQPCRRSKRVRCMNRSRTKFSDGFSFVSGTMPVEEVARCLMMMSNDTRSVADFSGSLSAESDGVSTKYSDEISFEPKLAYKKLDCFKNDYAKTKRANEEDVMHSREKQRNTRKISNNKHECPICFRVFKSGQAMGGHKRSHFLGGVEEVPKVHPLIDLNFPAFMEEGEGEDNDRLLPW